MTPHDPPGDRATVLPHGRELSLLLELRSRAHGFRRHARHAADALSDADLLTTAFLLTEARAGALLVDDPAVAAMLRDADLSDYAFQRNSVSLTIDAASPVSQETTLPSGVVLLWNAGDAAACPVGRLADDDFLILYGVRGPVDVRALVTLLNQPVIAPWTLLSLAARVLPLWRANSLLFTPAAHAARHVAALARLESILQDTTLDPLALAEEVFRLRSERPVATPLESTRVSDLLLRVGELEEEVLLLRDRLEKQQRAFALDRYLPPGVAASPVVPGQELP